MIEFIIYEEEQDYQNICSKIINNLMMNYDVEYLITTIKSFNDNWKQILEKDTFKICILNVKTRKESGYTIAQYIREIQKDWQSMLVFISNYQEYKYELLEQRFMQIDYIYKKDANFEKKLKDTLNIGLANYNSRPNTLNYSYHNCIYNIDLSKIIYIEKEQDSKRCLIKTTTKEYIYPGNLHQLETKLDNKFIKCNRSYIINIEQVEQYNIKDNIITFKNQNTLETISRDKRKIIIEHLRNI